MVWNSSRLISIILFCKGCQVTTQHHWEWIINGGITVHITNQVYTTEYNFPYKISILRVMQLNLREAGVVTYATCWLTITIWMRIEAILITQWHTRKVEESVNQIILPQTSPQIFGLYIIIRSSLIILVIGSKLHQF